MAKTPSDKLYRLVKSLSPAEKRYFKLFVRTKSERNNKYIQLFDLIDYAEVFDDEALKTKIYKSQSAEGKKYPELKAYLYDFILKCLQSFDEQRSVKYRINHLLQSVSVLFKRALYDDCRELLHKAAKLAKHYDCFADQIEIFRWEKQLAYTQMDVDYLQKELERLHYEEMKAVQQLQNVAVYRQLFFQIYTTIKREALHRGEDRMAQLRTLVGPPHYGDPDKALSHTARVYYYRALNLFHYAALEQEAFYDTGQKLIALLESQPHFLQESLAEYIASLSNLILSCGLLHKYDEVRACLQKLKNLTPLTEDDRRKIHRQYYTNKFVLCIYTGDFEEGKREMMQHLQESATVNPQEYETASFYFQYFCICFGCEDYDGALDYLNLWLNQPRTVEREDLQSTARILSLIIHFEKGNTVLLESLLRSATRYLQSKNRLYELEKWFIHYMSNLQRVHSSREAKTIFLKMEAELAKLSEQPSVRALLQTFDLQAWIGSRIQGKTFAQVVREKKNLG